MLRFLLTVWQLNSLGTNGFHPTILPSSGNNWWIAGILFTCFTILIILRVFDSRRMLLLFQAFIRASTVSTAYREESVISSRVSIFLLVNYLLMMALFSRYAALCAGIDPDGLKTFGLVAIVTACIYLVKMMLVRIMGWIFDQKEMSREYVYNILLFNKALGLVLFPLCLLLAYARQIPSEWLIWTGFVCIIIVLLYRLLRMTLIGMSSSSFSFFYLILYLCTLELLPFVVLIKVFVVNFQVIQPLQNI